MKTFKKRDIIIFVSILLIAFTVTLFIWLRPFEGELRVAIYIDGQLIDRYPLDDGYYRELPIQTVYGANTLIISEGTVWVQDSDCANNICVRQGGASRPGDVIVCAPHRLVIKVEAVNE